MRIPIILCLAIFLAGCATTEYSQREGSFWGSGYYDKKLQEGVYKVGYTGNASTRGDAAEDLALLRAADVALQNGYNYFVVIDRAKRTNVSSSYTPLMPYTYKGNTYYTGGYSTDTYTPDIELTVRCYIKKPLDTRQTIFDAGEIKANLSGKYVKKKDGAGKGTIAAENKDKALKKSEPDKSGKEAGMSPEDQAAAERAFNMALGRS